MTENKWRSTAFLNLTRDQVQSSVVGSGGWACTLGPNDICVGNMVGSSTVNLPCVPFHYLRWAMGAPLRFI